MGGNVFDNTSPIRKKDIAITLKKYFEELSWMYPGLAGAWQSNVVTLGSAFKKDISNDIDLGISNTLFSENENSLAAWNLKANSVFIEHAQLIKRARSSLPHQLFVKACLKIIAKDLSENSDSIMCDVKKITTGNMFTQFPQYDYETERPNGKYVQIDWMIGDLKWLQFAYYSAEYPKDSNVKGLHRTQLLLAMFDSLGMSFKHLFGVSLKANGESLANTPRQAMDILSRQLGIKITVDDSYDFYKLLAKLQLAATPGRYSDIMSIYFKILDSTRCDIPDCLQQTWIIFKEELGLTGKFLPENSKLKEWV